MPEETITTDVDALLALVEQKKRITYEDAAKELNISPSVVEKLASFLEEEGLLEIKYQLTTPYVVWKEPEKALAKKPMPKAPPKPIPLKEEKMPEKKKLETVEETKEAIREVYTLLNQAKVDDAKKLYREVRERYDSLPRKYLAAKKEFEQELVKLNTELTLVVDKAATTKVKDARAKIEGLLVQAQKHLKSRDWKTAAKVYNEIKKIYRSMPMGFFRERAELSEKILGIYEQLTALHNEVSKKEMADKTAELNALLNRIHQAMNSQQLSYAMSLYKEAKEKYAALPPGFLEEKMALQERMLTLFRDLSVAKKTYSIAELREKAETIARFLEQINGAIEKNEIEKAVSLYNHVKELYTTLPQGFLAEQRDIHSSIIKVYKRLIKARREHAVVSVKFGSSKISNLVDKAKQYLSSKQYDMASQLYREIIDEYNLLPEGYVEEKALLRNAVYDIYYDVVSVSDIAQFGYLDEYSREKYFVLLKLLVTMHKVIDAGELPLLSEIYASINKVYNDLPLRVVQQHGKLVQEVNRAYSLMRIYEAVQKLDTLRVAGKYSELRETLGFLGVELVKASRESPEDKVLLAFAKDRYMKYVEYTEGKREEIPPVQQSVVQAASSSAAFSSLPSRFNERRAIEGFSNASTLLAKEEHLSHDIVQEKEVLKQREHDIRSRLDKLTQCKQMYEQAQQYMADKNYNEAIIVLGQLLAIDPTYPNARAMMNNLEKIKMDEYLKDLLVSLVKSKKEKAIASIAERDYDSAIAYIQSILELDPTNVEAQYMLQTAKAERGR